MSRLTLHRPAVLLIAIISVLCAARASAQERRRAGPPGDHALPTLPGYDARFPFAGLWRGTRTMLGESPDAGVASPIAMIFRVVDSVHAVYDGETMDDPRQAHGAPHRLTMVEGHEMRWEQKNNGPGVFDYTVRLVTSDSITGTVRLRDGVLPGPPYGEITLVRQRTARP